jgi:hypothetical protein
MIIVLCRDLMFSSRISATAAALSVPIQMVRDVAKLTPELYADRMIVDLNQDGFLAAAADWKRRTSGRVVGFVGHMDGETIARAKSEGLDEILARSAFVARFEEIILGVQRKNTTA